MNEDSGNILDTIGLGKITPIIKSGINDLSKAEKSAVYSEIIKTFEDTNGDFVKASGKTPPLGGFQYLKGDGEMLSSKRMAELISSISNRYAKIESDGNIEEANRCKQISVLFNLIKDLFDNFNHFDNRASASNFSKLRM